MKGNQPQQHLRTMSSNVYTSYASNGRSPVFQAVYYPCLENKPGIFGSGGRNSSTGGGGARSYRSGSREKSYSRLNLKSREDPLLKQRLEGLMRCTSTYKTKAAGSVRVKGDGTRVVIEKSGSRM